MDLSLRSVTTSIREKIRVGGCCTCCCLTLPFLLVCFLNVILFSVHWRKRSRVQWIYFGFCFLTVFGSVLLVGAGCYQRAADLGSGLYITGLIMFSFLLLFVLCSYATVCTSVWYVLMMAILLFVSILLSTGLWPQININETTANSIKSLIVISHICIFSGSIANLVLSVTNHWLIYRVGASTRVCCITKCGCYNCCLCCDDRETRLKFNNVTLYHQTLAENADKIIQSQIFKPGREGMAGGGIYFATKPPSTEGKARVRPADDKKMLGATVRLGKIFKMNINGLEGYNLPGYRRETTCVEMIDFLNHIKCDSVWIPRERPEFVVYQSDQVVDIREVNY